MFLREWRRRQAFAVRAPGNDMPPRSKIQQLPPEDKAWLDKALISGNFSGYEALEAALAERGYQIGKSSINRYGQNLERKLSAIKASTDAAAAIAEAAPDDSDLRSAAVISLVQTELFDLLVALQEVGDEGDPIDRAKLMARIAKSASELSRASVNQKKWQASLRDKIGGKLDALEGEAQKGKNGFDLETLRRVREELYGIV